MKGGISELNHGFEGGVENIREYIINIITTNVHFQKGFVYCRVTDLRTVFVRKSQVNTMGQRGAVQ